MRRTRLLTLLGLPAAAAVTLVAVPLVSSAPSGYDLPDLRSSVPPITGEDGLDGVWLQQNGFSGEGQSGRLLLRFDGYIDNAGHGPVDFQGNPQVVGQAQSVRQFIRNSSTGVLEPAPVAVPSSNTPSNPACTASYPANAQPPVGPCVVYSTADLHNHFHVVNAARYTLLDGNGGFVAPGSKVGFCLYDIAAADDPKPVYDPTFYGTTSDTGGFCQRGNPGSTTLREGTSAGHRDVYDSELPFQWVDVTNTAPGLYRLGSQVDPDNRILEENEGNNQPAFVNDVVIPGYRAKPVSAATPAGQPVAVTFSADRFGSTSQVTIDGSTSLRFGNPSDGNRRFRIVSAPSNGTLRSGATTLGAGSVVSATTVTYTPNQGVNGVTDTFSYSAFDSASPFPKTPPTASVSVAVGTPAPAVAISGNPATLIVGTSAPLSATVSNAAPGVTWRVNGVVGGNATVGTITAAGVYTAPAAVPAGGTVTITATSTAAPTASAQVTIGIVPAPASVPVPLPRTTGGPGGNPVLGKPAVGRLGSRVVVALTPRRSGKLGITLFRGSRRAGTCVVKATAGRRVACSFRVARGTPRGRVRVVAVLISTGSRARVTVTARA